MGSTEIGHFVVSATILHHGKWVPLATNEEDDPVIIAKGGESARKYLQRKLADPARAARVSAFRKSLGEELSANRQGVETLTTLRLRAGLSQTSLAERIGTQQPNIARWEKSPTGIQIENVMKLADALGMGVDAVASVIAKQLAAHADRAQAIK